MTTMTIRFMTLEDAIRGAAQIYNANRTTKRNILYVTLELDSTSEEDKAVEAEGLIDQLIFEGINWRDYDY